MIEIGVLINSSTEFSAGRRPSSLYYHMVRQLRPVRTNPWCGSLSTTQGGKKNRWS
jgi:hypothetical protein